MIEETEDMRTARHELEELTVSDPAATSNMMRYVAALGIMLIGRPGKIRVEPEPRIMAGFRLMGGSHHLCAAVAARTGIDQIYVAFDVDDAAGPPLGLGLFRNEGEEVAIYGLCRLWSSAGEGRAVLVPSLTGDHGHFAFQPGAPLRHLNGLPPGDLEAGFRRASARLSRLVSSAELGDAHRGGWITRFRNHGRDISAAIWPMAA